MSCGHNLHTIVHTSNKYTGNKKTNVNGVLRNWRSKEYTGGQLDRHTCSSTLLFGDDETIIQESEDWFQLAAHNYVLNII